MDTKSNTHPTLPEAPHPSDAYSAGFYLVKLPQSHEYAIYPYAGLLVNSMESLSNGELLCRLYCSADQLASRHNDVYMGYWEADEIAKSHSLPEYEGMLTRLFAKSELQPVSLDNGCPAGADIESWNYLQELANREADEWRDEIEAQAASPSHKPEHWVMDRKPDRAEFYIMGEKTPSITVFYPREIFGELYPAEIQWEHVGTTSPAKAAIMGKALQAAATEAEALNKDAGL